MNNKLVMYIITYKPTEYKLEDTYKEIRVTNL